MLTKIERTFFFVLGIIFAEISWLAYDRDPMGLPFIVNTAFCVWFFGLSALGNALAVVMHLKSRW